MRTGIMIFFCMLCLAGSQEAMAEHVMGGEIAYTFVSANESGETYKVTLTLYGDCGQKEEGSNTYSRFSNAHPLITLFDGAQRVGEQRLEPDAQHSNIEITPICPDEAGQTRCTSPEHPYPGIMKFEYTGYFTMTYTSTSWRFAFEGSMDKNLFEYSSGRSRTANNVDLYVPPNPLAPEPFNFERQAAHIYLEAYLNNTTGPNTSPVFGSVAMPFFCAKTEAEYHLAALDADDDALHYSLIPGQITTTKYVTYYNPPFTPQEPLPAAGGLQLNAEEGILRFTPEWPYNCMVVVRTDEYRGGVWVGSSMREMVFFILRNCNNNAPTVQTTAISNAGVLQNTPGHLVLTACEGQEHPLSFDVTPSDPDGDNTRIKGSFLPEGASITVSNDGTSNTKGRFSWSPIDAAPGKYMFYITYYDDGCPAIASRTAKYTINILPHPHTFKGGSDASCFSAANGTAWALPENTNELYTYKWVSPALQVLQTHNSTTGDTLNNIPQGVYKVYIRNSSGCGKNVVTIVDSVLHPEITLPSDTTLCNDVIWDLRTATRPYEQYLWNTGATTSNLMVTTDGVYRLRVTNNCGAAEDDIRVNYVKCNYCFFVPNAFSPNGDGRNDRFTVLETCNIDKYQLQIFNRWGKLLFTALSTTNSWDGTYNGQAMESGVYYYRINARLVNGNKEAIRQGGDITLIR